MAASLTRSKRVPPLKKLLGRKRSKRAARPPAEARRVMADIEARLGDPPACEPTVARREP